MGLYIKRREMPKSCAECFLYQYDEREKTEEERHICLWKSWARLIRPTEERQGFCPLVEVKTPHGRLIDADELESKMLKTYRYFNVKFDLAEAETVVEREM